MPLIPPTSAPAAADLAGPDPAAVAGYFRLLESFRAAAQAGEDTTAIARQLAQYMIEQGVVDNPADPDTDGGPPKQGDLVSAILDAAASGDEEMLSQLHDLARSQVA